MLSHDVEDVRHFLGSASKNGKEVKKVQRACIQESACTTP